MIETSDQTDITAPDVDRHVGRRLREKRIQAGFSQSDLGRCVGVTFQQIQKYERGANRISAGVLYRFARVFEEPVASFFAGLPGQSGAAEGAEPQDSFPPKRMGRETLEFMRLYCKIEDPRLRRHVKSLLQTLQTHPKG